jgi:type IV secretory pathway TrbF-like protein
MNKHVPTIKAERTLTKLISEAIKQAKQGRFMAMIFLNELIVLIILFLFLLNQKKKEF